MLEKARNFIVEVGSELGRVNWPTREELVNSTTVIFVFSIIFAVFIGLFDLILSYVRALLTEL
ncbi:MAG: preprotein translocase subunit SecE [Candidatus Latescibacterota bacterium]|nr:preprotein translocase subunit SecE [Candidatus Latescibacterota bacterium]